MNSYDVILFGVSIVVGLLRPVFVVREFNKHVSASYQAIAHILVGLLLGLWWETGWSVYASTLVVLTVIEVLCAVVTVIKKRL